MKSTKLQSQRLMRINETYNGGYVLQNGHQVAFDYISNVRRLRDGHKGYEILKIQRKHLSILGPKYYNRCLCAILLRKRDRKILSEIACEMHFKLIGKVSKSDLL